MTEAAVLTNTVRLGTIDDRDAILRMADAFVRETDYRDAPGMDVRPDVWWQTVTAFLQGQLGCVFVSENERGEVVGMIVGTVYPNFANGCMTASEIVMWVDPHARAQGRFSSLLRAFEQWARDRGAIAVHLVSWARPLDRIYEAFGYRELERVFVKTTEE